MKTSGLAILMVSLTALAQGCSSGGGSKSSGPAPAAAGATGTDTSASTATATSTAAAAGTGTGTGTAAGTSNPTSYFTGFDGTDSFAILVPSFRTFTVTDPTIAKIDTVTVQISDTQFAALQAALKVACPTTSALTLNQMMSFFGQSRSVQRITPLKPGTTTLVSQPPADATGGPPGGGGGGGGNHGTGTGTTAPTLGTACSPDFQALRSFGSGSHNGHGSAAAAQTVNLTVTQYTTAQVQAGQQRYTTALDSNDPACTYCHMSGKYGAPSHALGDVGEISDADAGTWITTGVLGTRSAETQAHIPHAWKFSDANQQAGVIAYLRTLATSDAEQLLVDEFNEVFGVQLDAAIVTGSASSAPAATATAAATTTATSAATTTTP